MELEAYYNRCVGHLSKGQFIETESLAQKWIEMSPDELDPYTLLVFVYQAQMKWHRLFEAGEKYLRLWDDGKNAELASHTRGDRWKVLLFMGQAQLSLNDKSAAERLFEKSVAAAGDRVACLTAIAKIYKSRREYKESLVYLRKAMECNPEDKDILYDIARLHERLGNMESSIGVLKMPVLTGSLGFLDLMEILDYEIEGENWQEAEKILKKTIEDYPPDIEVFLRAGIIFRKLGTVSRAVTYLEEAAKIAPQDPRVFGFIGFLFAELGKSEDAHNVIHGFLGNEVNCVTVHLAAAWSFWLHGRVEDSVSALDRICGLLNINYDETISSFTDLVRVWIKLAIELKQKMGLLEEHLALEIAARIGKDTGVSVDDVDIQKTYSEGYGDAGQGRSRSVSLCMIVKDEEAFLDKCLQSVSPLVDEVVIVDTGSKDRTVEIAGGYGAGVYHFKWCDDYSKARNFCIRQARCDWILIMDADEVIAEKDLPKIRRLLADEQADGYRFILRNYENDRTLANIVLNPHDYEEGTGYFGFIPSSLIRLFRRDRAAFFSGAVHETLDYSFERSDRIAKSTDIPIHHYGKVLPHLYIKRKRELYRRLGEKRVKEHPGDVAAVKGLSDQYLEMGMYQKALELLEGRMRLAPDNPELHFNLGRACEALNMTGRAMQEYIVTLKLNPTHIGAYNNLALIYSKQGNYHEAVKVLKTGIEKGGAYPVFYHNLGNMYGMLKDYDQALHAYKKALQIDPGFPGTNNRIGHIFIKQNNYPAAEEAFQREIEIGGDSETANKNIQIIRS